jgi:hypothetical protein
LKNAWEKSPVSFVVFRRQLPSPEHSRGSRGSGEAIEALGKLQDRFPRAGIGQLPSHLPRLLGAVEPLEDFVRYRRHWSSFPYSFLMRLSAVYWGMKVL